MKFLIIFMIVVSCGKSTSYKFEYNDTSLVDRVEKLELKAELLDDLLIASNEHQALIDDLQVDLFEVNEILTRLRNDITSLKINQTSYILQLQALRIEVNNMNTVLQRTTEVIELCQAGGEVLIRTADDRLIAFFETGNKRYLSVLTDGHYMTSDRERCRFTVLNNQVL